MRRFVPLVMLLAFVISGYAGDLRITLPKRSKPTPVQKLNQDGVKAVQKHNYDKARKLFYKAYLLDPDDPFTLNNLGYISELSGELERAQRFYALAAEQNSEASIEYSSVEELEGKSVRQAAGNAGDRNLQINRYNVAAMVLLNKDRAPEADLMLQKALGIDPSNPFTLNNLGFAKEKEGEFESALGYYNRAALSRSNENVVVAMKKNWRGKPIGEVAAENASKLRRLIEREDVATRVARLNLRGVSAINRNERAEARRLFEQAYKLDPNHAFTLNNMGYVAELDSDRETADFYYAKAREAEGAGREVRFATRRDAVGRELALVASNSNQRLTNRIELERQARARRGGPIQLRRRDNTPVIEPATPVEPRAARNLAPNEVLLPPAPSTQAEPVDGSPQSGAQSSGQTGVASEHAIIPEQNYEWVVPPLPPDNNQQPPPQ